MTEAELAITDLRRHFGGVLAVNGASFEVRRTSITGLIGPNGAGKSTVLSMISGAIKPDAGSIRFDGEEIAGMATHQVARRAIIRTFQTPSEFFKLTVLENLLVAAPRRRGNSVGGALLGKWWWRAEEAQLVEASITLLRRFEMLRTANLYAGDLSSGQKRLLELMRALIARPRILLLDEPFAGVNPALARRIETYLSALKDEGLTILMVEHEMGAIERVCDSVVVMAQGQVISHGTMAEIRQDQRVLDAYITG